jgi:hypothetical protein
MGKKKTQPRLQESLGNLVSKAALTKLLPDIENVVRAHVKNLGGHLAVQQASTLETLFARTIVLEKIIMEKHGLTLEDLTKKVADVEDEKEGLVQVEEVQVGDVARVEIRTRTKEQTEFQGSSRMKISQTGTGQTIGEELEKGLLGMKTGETKEVEFGQDKAMIAQLRLDRVSRPVAQQGTANDNQPQG